MFSMTSLQSQNSPLRTLQTFYKPINRPHSRSVKKTFPTISKQSQISQLYNPTSHLNKNELSTKKYLDNLQRNKTLQRRNRNRGELNAYISFRRGDDPESSNNSSSVMSKQQSTLTLKLSTVGVSRVSSLCSILDKKHQNSFQNKWRQFSSHNTAQNQQAKNKLRFTFYNNHQKNKSIMSKYWKDQSLQHRGSNEYQNVFNRTIVEDSLVRLLERIDRKRRKGEVV